MGSPRELLDRVDGLRAIWWRHGDRVEHLAGDRDTEEEHGGRRVRAGPGAFVQVNRAAAEGLRRAVETALGPVRERRVVDAYCGVGESGRYVALQGGTAIGIEVDRLAVAAARQDAPEGFEVLRGAVEDRLEEALPADVLVLNPPRGGLEETLPARIGGSGVERIVYVSCDPATLARDLDRIGEGYHVTSVEAFDLFPQTAHVEVLTVLDLCPGDGCGTCATS
jgi:23S rRNA (uracil1939-C5)-methyltransferase